MRDKSINIKALHTQHTSWGGFAGMGWLQRGEQLLFHRLGEFGHILDSSLVGGTSMRPGGCRKVVLPSKLSLQSITEQMWAPQWCGNSLCVQAEIAAHKTSPETVPLHLERDQPLEERCLLSLR